MLGDREYIDANVEESGEMPANTLFPFPAQHLRLHNFSATAKCFFPHPSLLPLPEVHAQAIFHGSQGPFSYSD
jgi:hypothetical protein